MNRGIVFFAALVSTLGVKVPIYQSRHSQLQTPALDEGESVFALSFVHKLKADPQTPKYLAVVCACLLVSILLFFALSPPAKEPVKIEQEEEEKEVAAVEEAQQETLIKEETTRLDAKEPQKVDEEAGKVEESETAPQDYEAMVNDMMQKAQDKFGPKFQAGGEVAKIFEDKAATFADKAKALVLNELNDTAGSVARALEEEDFMALLEWDATIAANFPSLSILLAGLLVPVQLSINYACHLSQLLLVSVPLLSVLIWAEYADWNHPCYAIPGLRPWARIVLVALLACTVARILMMKQIKAAEGDLKQKSAEMRAEIAKAEEDGEISVGDLKTLFLNHSTVLQYAIVCENRCNSSIFAHMVGAGTLVWLLSTFFNLFVYFKYMFVPGVVAFHISAAGDPTYCAAWSTACASKVAVLVATLFFFMNLCTVFCWLTQTVLNVSSEKIAAAARSFDNANMGIPFAQLVVKAFVSRAQTDVLIAKFAVSMREKSDLAREYTDTETRLMALKAQVERKEQAVKKIEEEIDNQGGGTIESSLERMTESGLDFNVMQQKGAAIIDAAKAQAAGLEAAATDEIEKLVEQLQELMNQVTESDSYKAAQAKAAEAKAAAEEAAKQAQVAAEEAAKQAQAAAQDAAKQAQEMAEQASKQAQELAEQAKASAGDAMEKLQDPALIEQAQAMASQAQQQGEAMAAKVQATAKDLK
jgi:hypothetical protein